MKLRILLLLCAIPLWLCGQQLTEATTQDVAINSQRLQQVDQLIENAIDQKWLPGGVFLIARKGKIIFHKSFGKRAPQQPYQNQDIFRIASMTKAITVVAVMQLFEQGKLGLDDPLHWYLPAYKEMTILDEFNADDSSHTTKPASKPITIRQLLTHTSGITYGDFNPGKISVVYGKYDMLGVGLAHETWNNQEFIDRLAQVPLVFEPGERYLYGLNMDVLGRVVEVITSKTLNEYFQDHIFTPMGMEDTHFYLPKSKHKRLVPLYTATEEGPKLSNQGGLARALDYPLSKDKGMYAGGGGLSSTAEDYARFIQMLLNRGKYNSNQILAPQTVDLIRSDQIISLNREGKGFTNIPGITFGLGFAVFTEEAAGFSPKSPGTYEWGGYFNTKYFIDPQEELIFVGMTQILPFPQQHFWDRLYAVIYASLED